MKDILIEELSSPGCSHCKEFEAFWHSIEGQFLNVKYRDISIVTPEGMEMAGKYGILASPGIIINGELWASGGFDKDKFVKKLKEVSQ
jgi:glutaredoxin